MDSPRSLRAVFDELVSGAHADRDPAALLREAGHHDLPGSLIADAIVSYADTAPVALAEHLAPFVTAHTAAASDEPADPTHGLRLLGTAPVDDLDAVEIEGTQFDGAPFEAAEITETAIPFGAGSDDLDFGAGDTAADMPADTAPEEPAEVPTVPAPQDELFTDHTLDDGYGLPADGAAETGGDSGTEVEEGE
ncbi:MAG: hypothetical protein GEU86_08545 [Actinophytocola sp.]|nr:hypothetical protein [Actinophytocola sp.]